MAPRKQQEAEGMAMPDVVRIPHGLGLDDKLQRIVWSGLEEEYGEPEDWAGALDAFLKVEDPNSALKFAKRYGVLGLCEKHRLPSTHSRDLTANGLRMPCSPKVVNARTQTYSEPVAEWISYARKARTILNVAYAVRSGESGTPDDLAFVFDDLSQRDIGLLASNPVRTKYALSHLLTRWLAVGNTAITFEWWEAQPRIVAARETFSEIAIQLATAIARGAEPAICVGCGKQEFRERRAQKGRKVYCRDCRARGIDDRDRQRARRERVREETG